MCVKVRDSNERELKRMLGLYEVEQGDCDVQQSSVKEMSEEAQVLLWQVR